MNIIFYFIIKIYLFYWNGCLKQQWKFCIFESANQQKKVVVIGKTLGLHFRKFRFGSTQYLKLQIKALKKNQLIGKFLKKKKSDLFT
jgi:hypothetical protein